MFGRWFAAGCSTMVLFVLVACEPAYHDVGCWLPILRTDESTRIVVKVGDPEDRGSDTCPLPVARTFEAERSYGTVKFEWWGSPHRLYISARSNDGAPLDVSGARVEPFVDVSGSWLKEYSHRIDFSGNDLLGKPAPQDIEIEILDRDGRSLDTISAVYDTVRCSCSVPEAYEGAPELD